MKPYVILVGTKADKIEFTKDELEKLVADAYERGYSDGMGYSTIANYGSTGAPAWQPYRPSITTACSAEEAAQAEKNKITCR